MPPHQGVLAVDAVARHDVHGAGVRQEALELVHVELEVGVGEEDVVEPAREEAGAHGVAVAAVAAVRDEADPRVLRGRSPSTTAAVPVHRAVVHHDDLVSLEEALGRGGGLGDRRAMLASSLYAGRTIDSRRAARAFRPGPPPRRRRPGTYLRGRQTPADDRGEWTLVWRLAMASPHALGAHAGLQRGSDGGPGRRGAARRGPRRGARAGARGRRLDRRDERDHRRARLAAEVTVVTHDRNQGKGAAIRTARRKARGEICAIFDADLEYDPADLVPLMEPILSGEANAVLRGAGLRGPYEPLVPVRHGQPLRDARRQPALQRLPQGPDDLPQGGAHRALQEPAARGHGVRDRARDRRSPAAARRADLRGAGELPRASAPPRARS